jgi:hypothetical protein
MTPPALPPEAQIMQLLLGRIMSFTMSAVAELGLADHMGAEPTSVEDLAARTSTHAPSLYRVLRMLTSVGVFGEPMPRRFVLTPVGQMLRSDAPNSMRYMAMMFTDPWIVRAYENIVHCLRTGGDGVTKAYGKHAFELFKEIPNQAATFHHAMTNFSAISGKALVEAYDFSRFQRIADVGGGHGIILGNILRATPGLQGVLYDLPEVIAGAAPSGNLAGLEDRLIQQSGSFFEAVPEGCDAYLMKHIIHDWDDERGRRILSLMRDQLKDQPEGRVFLYEMVVPEDDQPSPAKLLDIEMLVATVGGKERTEQEFRELFCSAGLMLERITPTKSPMCLIEARVV